MTGREISAIKIKKLYYADVLVEAPTKQGLTAALSSAKEISNSHQGTFQYEQSEPTVNKYKNQLTGAIYRSDQEEGEKQISFVIGRYNFELKAALQGGTATADTWTSGKAGQVSKAFYAITEDDVCIVFPKASIVARGSSTDNAIGLAVKAIPEEISSTIKDEYWIDMV